ncbi:MAG: hypothetical protein WCI36_01120 [bacterium]
MENTILPAKIIDKMIKDKAIRVAITKESHFMFFHLYFAHYVKYPTADFQREIFALTEDTSVKNLFVVAFRGSAKSTIITTSYPIWAILGEQQKKFVVILSQTRNQARQHMGNIKYELENNELLKNDLGPFKESSDEWGMATLVFPKLNARISVASYEQSVRGLRHGQHRPDLIIGDDVEDLNSTRTREGRDKTHRWLTGEIIPSGDRDTRLVVVGNLLHEDSLLMRIKQDVEEEKLNGLFRSYPLIDENGEILWKGKYKDNNAIEEEKKKTGDDIAWQREYLLRIVPSDGQIIYSDWIQYYDELPKNKEPRYTGIGIDLAISKNDTADYTAIVSGDIHDYGSDMKIYVHPNPINERMNFPETVMQIKALACIGKRYPFFYIEEVAYQTSLIEQLKYDGVKNVKGVKVHGQDKRMRLSMTAHLIKSGKVLFPRKGAEKLIQQLTGFGVEKHDDLSDAFANLVLKAIEENRSKIRVFTNKPVGF